MYCPHYKATLFSNICKKRQEIASLASQNSSLFDMFKNCYNCIIGKEVKILYSEKNYPYDYDILAIKYEHEKFKKIRIFKKLKKKIINKKLKRKKINGKYIKFKSTL